METGVVTIAETLTLLVASTATSALRPNRKKAPSAKKWVHMMQAWEMGRAVENFRMRVSTEAGGASSAQM